MLPCLFNPFRTLSERKKKKLSVLELSALPQLKSQAHFENTGTKTKRRCSTTTESGRRQGELRLAAAARRIMRGERDNSSCLPAAARARTCRACRAVMHEHRVRRDGGPPAHPTTMPNYHEEASKRRPASSRRYLHLYHCTVQYMIMKQDICRRKCE